MSTFVIFLDNKPVHFVDTVISEDDKEYESIDKLYQTIVPILKSKKVKAFDWFGNQTGDFTKNNVHLIDFLYRDSITYEPYVNYINWHMLKDNNGEEISINVCELEAIKNDSLLSQDYSYKEIVSKLNIFTK